MEEVSGFDAQDCAEQASTSQGDSSGMSSLTPSTGQASSQAPSTGRASSTPSPASASPLLGSALTSPPSAGQVRARGEAWSLGRALAAATGRQRRSDSATETARVLAFATPARSAPVGHLPTSPALSTALSSPSLSPTWIRAGLGLSPIPPVARGEVPPMRVSSPLARTQPEQMHAADSGASGPALAPSIDASLNGQPLREQTSPHDDPESGGTPTRRNAPAASWGFSLASLWGAAYSAGAAQQSEAGVDYIAMAAAAAAAAKGGTHVVSPDGPWGVGGAGSSSAWAPSMPSP